MKFTINIRVALLVVVLTAFCNRLLADGSLAPFYKVGTTKGTLAEVAEKVKASLKASSFEVLGEYHPAKQENLLVVAFTRKDLTEITIQTKNRGALASSLKVGLIADSLGNVDVSLVNPIYIFYAYLRDDVSKNEEMLNAISQDALTALSSIGRDFKPYGGRSLNEIELENFRYIPKMPNFDEPISLGSFSSFDDAVSTIRRNLTARKNGTIKVYEISWPDQQVAVFGVGLLDIRMGENRILEVLSEQNIAAFPYEVIISGKQASMLNGRFRFPLFWSDLSMVEFRKLNKTTRDIQDMLESLTKQAGQ